MSATIVAAAIAALTLAALPAAGDGVRSAENQVSDQTAVATAESRVPQLTASVGASASATWYTEQPTINVLPLPAVHRQAPPAPITQNHRYRFHVPLAGHQAAVDRCAGFVWESFGVHGRVVSAHNTCGGDVILRLRVGDLVTLTGHGDGTYRVTQVKAVPKHSSTSVLEGHTWMQTCYFDRPALRLVRLTPVD